MKIRVILIAALLSGCVKVHDYELEKLSEACGGKDQIRDLYMDLYSPRAICKNGRSVGINSQ